MAASIIGGVASNRSPEGAQHYVAAAVPVVLLVLRLLYYIVVKVLGWAMALVRRS